MKNVFLVLLLFLSVVADAQESSVASRLREAYRLAWANGSTYDDVKSVMSGISEGDIANEADSIKYFFYYIVAGILDDEERELDLRDRYIDAAIALREKSVGILSSEYIELLWLKSWHLVDSEREDEAMRLCQKGIVVGYELVEGDYPAARYWYAKLMELLGDLYTSKGYHNQLVSLYNESFDLLKDRYDEEDASLWSPLLSLYLYYYEKEMYEEAYQTNERLGEHIRINGGENTYDYAATYKYQRGNILRQLGRIEEAVETYCEGARMLVELGGKTDESLAPLYGNWQITLVENGMFQETAVVEEAMTEYYTAIGKTEELATVYWASAVLSIELGADDKALEYISRSERYYAPLALPEKERILALHGKILFNHKRYKEAIAVKKQALALSLSAERRIINSLDLAYITLYVDEAKAMEIYEEELPKLNLRDSFQLEQYKIAISSVLYKYQEEGNYEEERHFIAEQLNLITPILGKKDCLNAELLNSMAVSFLLQGEGESAIPLLEETQKIYEDLGLRYSSAVATLEHNLGRAYMLCGKYKKAYEHLSKSADLQQAIEGFVMYKTNQYLKEIEEMK